MDDDIIGHSARGFRVVIYCGMDSSWCAVALPWLAMRYHTVGSFGIKILFPPRSLYLPRVPREVQAAIYGGVMGLSHTENAQA